MQMPELYENFDEVVEQVVSDHFNEIQVARDAYARHFAIAGAVNEALDMLGIPPLHQTRSELTEMRRFVVGEYNAQVENQE